MTSNVATVKRRRQQKKADKTNVNIAGRSTSKKRDISGEFLEGTESSLTNIEATGAASFADAWTKEGVDRRGQSLDEAIDFGQDDTAERDLDQSRVGTIAGWTVFVVGAAALIFFFIQRGGDQDGDIGARASTNVERNILLSPLEEREYTNSEGPLTATTFTRLAEAFIDETGSGELVPNDDPDALTGRYLAGPVFWGGRVHVAVISSEPLLSTTQECVVSSLVTNDLLAVDVASAGACDAAFGATGDRVACRGDNIVLLEAWPFNPDAVTEPEVATAIRTRVEQRGAQETTSRRGTLELSTADGSAPVVAAAARLTGEPGDTATIELGNLSGTCELLDRSDVDVRLLPG